MGCELSSCCVGLGFAVASRGRVPGCCDGCQLPCPVGSGCTCMPNPQQSPDATVRLVRQCSPGCDAAAADLAGTVVEAGARVCTYRSRVHQACQGSRSSKGAVGVAWCTIGRNKEARALPGLGVAQCCRPAGQQCAACSVCGVFVGARVRKFYGRYGRVL